MNRLRLSSLQESVGIIHAQPKAVRVLAAESSRQPPTYPTVSTTSFVSLTSIGSGSRCRITTAAGSP